MADFSAALRNTLSKLDNPSDAVRQKVYEKARQAIQRKIDALPSAPPQAAIDRQFAKLDEAIAEVEADYATIDVADDPLSALLADVAKPIPEVPHEAPVEDSSPDEEIATPVATDGDGFVQPAPSVDLVEAAPIVAADPALDATTEPDGVDAVDDSVSGVDDVTSDADRADDPLRTFLDEQAPLAATERNDDDPLDAALNALKDESEAPSTATDSDVDAALSATPVIDDAPASDVVVEPLSSPSAMTERPRSRAGLWVSVLVVLLAIGGGAYAWVNHQQSVLAMLGMAGDDSGIPVRTVTTTEVAPPSEIDVEPEATPGEDAVASATEGNDVDKFTQRLTADGTEIDEGSDGAAPSPGEGSSVSEQSANSDTVSAPEAESGATPEQDPLNTANQQDAAPLPVGQRAVFYEERTGTQAGTSFSGAAIWTVAQESPAPGAELEPAIRVETSVPDLGLVMEMIIKRNGDETLPASHLIEVFFRVPGTFEGRGVADLQRISLKDTEGDPGNALFAVPAPLDTNIFFIALNSAETAQQTNLQLLGEREWFDIAIQYVTGRRALVSMEKGTAGKRVFDEVLAYWAANPL